MRLRERIRRGCWRAANNFINPWLPYRLFSEKVSHTITVAATTPNRIQTHWPMPAMYMITNTTNTASKPPAKMKRYCARSPLNSTSRPTPLLISISAIEISVYYRKKERRMVAATIRKIQAPNHELAVLEVSGSPELNFW